MISYSNGSISQQLRVFYGIAMQDWHCGNPPQIQPEIILTTQTWGKMPEAGYNIL